MNTRRIIADIIEVGVQPQSSRSVALEHL